jgi:Methyltransferase domain
MINSDPFKIETGVTPSPNDKKSEGQGKCYQAGIKHRNENQTEQTYKGIPLHAANGVHEIVTDLLRERLTPGAKIADIGAGHGALSMRLHDAGFEVTAFDLDCKDWRAMQVVCHECDMNDSLQLLAASGPYNAICAIEVIEHLENPRRFLRDLIELCRAQRTWIVMSTPNPLDTFSCIAMFTRGIFNWFSPQHYCGGGHISILPYWLIDEHLRLLGIVDQQWRFLSPFRHPLPWKRVLYRAISCVRRLVVRGDSRSFLEGQTALVIFAPDDAGGRHK